MNKLSLALAASTLIALLSGGAAQAQEVKIGFDAAPYPPFTAPDASGKWGGWEIEIQDALCAAAKLTCVQVPTAWDGIIPSLTSGKIDAIMSSMSITDERKKVIDFTDKYYNTPAAIVGPKDQTFGATPADLAGKVIGVQVSTTHAAYAKKHFTEAAEIKEYQAQDEINADLIAGRIDAMQADSIAVGDFLKTPEGAACCDKKGDAAPDPEVLGAGVGVGLRQGDTELKDKLNAAIKQIRADGTYDAISKKYFDFDIYGSAPQTN
jgi:polar amino acid transport system substrate-binding protein